MIMYPLYIHIGSLIEPHYVCILVPYLTLMMCCIKELFMYLLGPYGIDPNLYWDIDMSMGMTIISYMYEIM